MSKKYYQLLPLVALHKYQEFIQSLSLVCEEINKTKKVNAIPFMAFKLDSEDDKKLNIYLHMPPEEIKLVYTLSFNNSYNHKNALKIMKMFLERVKEFLNLYELPLNLQYDINLSPSMYSYVVLNENIFNMNDIQNLEDMRLNSMEL